MFEIAHSVEFQMSLLLFIALAGTIIASRINQSAVIGAILVGIIFGPSLLGLITYTDFVKSLAHLGAVVLLFVIGLEFKLKDLLDSRYAFIGALGVIIPWLGGYGIARLFGYGFGPAIFIGTALTATSIAITANVLREMGKLQEPTARAIIGAAVIDDILGLMALTISGSLVSGSVTITTIGMSLIKPVLFVVIGTIVGYGYLSSLISKIDRTLFAKKFPEFVFIFAMMLAFLYALTAELIGISAIIGAFIAGISLEGIGLRHSKNYRDGAEYLYIIFGSVFFVSLGILVDFSRLTWSVLGFLIVIIIIAVITKVIGCGIPALLSGMSKKDSLIIGLGMIPRGEVAMVVALIGLNQGLIGQDIYVTIVLMGLITTILAPLFLRKFMGNSQKEKLKW